jgi:hypothetical protein
MMASVATAPLRAGRIPINGVRHLQVSKLSPDEHERLCEETHRIHKAHFPDDDRELFERAFFSDNTTQLFLFYGSDGALAGFSALSLLWLSHDGKDHAVFKGVICVDSRYKLVWRARLPVVSYVVRWKALHPTTPAGYMGMVATPSGYRALANAVPRHYPSRRAPMPEAIKALLLKATRKRGFDPVDEERLLVRATSRIAHPERIRASQSLRDDPDARFYMEQNPRFGEFDMLMWVPIDARNLGHAALRMVWRHCWGDVAGQAR